ncbi:hypothetical protein ACFLQ0_05145 [Nitrospinota bacterium]
MQSRIPLLNVDEATGDTALFFEATKEFLGRVPNAARTLGHTPHIAKFFIAFNATLQREGAGGLLSCKIKEMVVLKTSHVNNCAY